MPRAPSRLAGPRIDFAREVVRPALPVILAPAARGHRRLPSWTPAGLVTRLGARRVRVAAARDGTFGYTRRRPRYRSIELSFAELVARITRTPRTGPALYLMQQPLERAFPELDAELRWPRWLERRSHARQLWLGGAGNVTPLHYDAGHNLFAQIYGRKRFVIFAPDQAALLYPHGRGSRYPHLCRVDPERPDLRAFPEHARARGTRFVLRPGELLFLPAGWFHHVRSLEVSISVNAWWTP